MIFNALFLPTLRGDSSAESRQDPLAPATSPMTKQKTQITIKFWKTIIALAAACFAGGFWETMAQETAEPEMVEVRYTRWNGVQYRDLVSARTFQIRKDIASLRLGGRIVELILPEGLTKLRTLLFGFANDDKLRERNYPLLLTLPKDIGKDADGDLKVEISDYDWGAFTLRAHINTKPLQMAFPFQDRVAPFRGRVANLSGFTDFHDRSTHYDIMASRDIWSCGPGEDGFLTCFERIPVVNSVRELVKNREPDDDGVFRIPAAFLSTDSLEELVTIEIFEFQPTLTMHPKAGGMTIGWKSGTLQRALRIEGPWEDIPVDDPSLDVMSGKITEGRIRIFLRPPFLPSKFFRIKPGSE